MDYYMERIGTLSEIVADAPIVSEEKRTQDFVLDVTIIAKDAKYRIRTDKYRRVFSGYINMEAVDSDILSSDDRIITTDPALIAALSRALSSSQTIRAGDKITLLSSDEIKAEYYDRSIPDDTDFSMGKSGFASI